MTFEEILSDFPDLTIDVYARACPSPLNANADSST